MRFSHTDVRVPSFTDERKHNVRDPSEPTGEASWSKTSPCLVQYALSWSMSLLCVLIGTKCALYSVNQYSSGIWVEEYERKSIVQVCAHLVP